MDAALAVVFATVQIASTTFYSRDGRSARFIDVYYLVPLNLGPAALLFRRRCPEAAVAILAATGYTARH